MIAEKENCTLMEFALRCARSFGALIEMREEPLDAPIPEKFEINPLYKAELEEAEKEYEDFTALPYPEKMAVLERDYELMAEKYAEADKIENERRRVLRGRYEAMLEKINKWEAPTPDHENLRKFMIEQIEDCMEHDCGHWESTVGDKEDWLNVSEHINYLKRCMRVARESYRKHVDAGPAYQAPRLPRGYGEIQHSDPHGLEGLPHNPGQADIPGDPADAQERHGNPCVTLFLPSYVYIVHVFRTFASGRRMIPSALRFCKSNTAMTLWIIPR